MKILTVLFGKQKPVVIASMSKETRELMKIADEYYERQRKKKKKFSELFGYMK